jgi:hypothetical protein
MMLGAFENSNVSGMACAFCASRAAEQKAAAGKSAPRRGSMKTP